MVSDTDLVSFIKVIECKASASKGTLVIMPFYKEYDFLGRHLDLLSKQTFRDFDVIIVLSSVSDDALVMEILGKRRRDYGIVLTKRKEDIGSAGGFFVGERYAIENGYTSVVYADADAMPEDSNLIRNLKDAGKTSDFIRPTVRLNLDGVIVDSGNNSFHIYSIINTSLLRKAGLHYMPLYLGYDDAELQERLNRFSPDRMIDSYVVHPYSNSLFGSFSKNVTYRINQMPSLNGYLNTYISGLVFAIFGQGTVRRGAFFLISSTFWFKYGRNVSFNEEQIRIPAPPVSGTARIVGLTDLPDPGKIFQYKIRDRDNRKQILSLIRFVFRNEVILKPVPSSGAIIAAIFAKETWIVSGRGYYLLARNRNPLLHALKLFLFMVMLPFFVLLCAFSFSLNSLRRPKTLGYGLD